MTDVKGTSENPDENNNKMEEQKVNNDQAHEGQEDQNNEEKITNEAEENAEALTADPQKTEEKQSAEPNPDEPLKSSEIEAAATDIESAEEEKTVTSEGSKAVEDTSGMQNAEEEAKILTGNSETTEQAAKEESEQTIKSSEVEAAATDISEDAEKQSSEKEDDSDKEDESEDEHEDELKDYTNFSKAELVETIKEISHSDDFRQADRILNEIKPLFDEMYNQERNAALEKFLEEGGEEADFSMKHDELNDRFEANFQLFKDRKRKFFKDQEKQKDENLKKKEEILDRLRELVDGEETITGLNVIKEIQKEWKAVGQVPGSQAKTLWANYNALLDRYYDQRSILYELKELDRRKNLEAKKELVVKAEALADSNDVPFAIKTLNDLHEEYKHIGPVPKEEQEPLWQKFKAASDAVYEKRKDYLKDLKGIQDANLEKKQAIIEKIGAYLEFNSDRIKEWNTKTKEVLAIQKEWESTGQVPKENAKDINKAFWSNFKGFFSNKHEFFKRLDAMREENMKKKQELVDQAEALKDSTEWAKTAEKLKQLQNQWREIGPVPEKYRESIYKQFKTACDAFFENKRAGNQEAEKEFKENLKAKEDIISQIKQLEPGDLEQLEAYEQAYSKIGFVPRNAIQKVKEHFSDAVAEFIEKSESVLSEEQLAKVKLMAQLTKIMAGPNSDRKLNQKEHGLRKKISDLENDIVTWKNNLEFFASSKTADKLKKEFDIKIEAAEKEIGLLKKQLRIVRSVD